MRALDQLATTRITRLAPARRRELFRAVEAAETAAELFHRHRARRAGRAAPDRAHTVHRAVPHASQSRAARGSRPPGQVHAPALWRADAGGFRALCPVSEATAAWVRRDRGAAPAPWQLVIRPDVGLEAGADGGLEPVLFETNATGLAGLYNHAAGVRILRTEVFPRVYTDREARALVDPPDLLALVVRWVKAAAAARRAAPPARGRVRGGCPAVRTATARSRDSSRRSVRPAFPPRRGR